MIIDIKTYIKFYGSSNLEGTNKLRKFECGWCHLPYYSSRKETKYCCQSHRVMASMDRAKKVKRGDEILKKHEAVTHIEPKKPALTTEQMYEIVENDKRNRLIKIERERKEEEKRKAEQMEKMKQNNRHIPGY